MRHAASFLLMTLMLLSACQLYVEPVTPRPAPVIVEPAPGPIVPPPVVPPPVVPPPVSPPEPWVPPVVDPVPLPPVGDTAAVLEDIETRFEGGTTYTEAEVTNLAGPPWRTVPSHVDSTVAWHYQVKIGGVTKDAELKFREGRLVSIVVGW